MSKANVTLTCRHFRDDNSMNTDAWGNLQAQSYTATKRSLIGICK